MAIITLSTDFGHRDGYNGAVIGAIKSLAPRTEVVEVSSEISSIARASLVLWRYYSFFPLGTIHMVVVDPTVGTARRPLAGTDGRYMFVGPDNGIFTRIMEHTPGSTWYEIDPSRLPVHQGSDTFHARDIFGPAAALLSMGKAPEILGHKISEPVTIDIPIPAIVGNLTKGEIIDIDSFGNLIINIPGEGVGKDAKVTLKTKSIPLKRTFADVRPGHPVAYIGSLGLLEIAVNGRSAQKYFKVVVGAKVTVKI